MKPIVFAIALLSFGACTYQIEGPIFSKQAECLEYVDTLKFSSARGLMAAADSLCNTNHSWSKFSGNAKCIENKARHGFYVQMECRRP